MRRYANLSGNSGVVAYDTGAVWIRVQFGEGKTYLYTYGSTGREAVEEMKRLAKRGEGLSGYIAANVRMAYARKELVPTKWSDARG